MSRDARRDAGLIRELRKELSAAHAAMRQLRTEYEQLEAKCEALSEPIAAGDARAALLETKCRFLEDRLERLEGERVGG